MKIEFCNIQCCNAEATKKVRVSVRRAGDSERKFCEGCYEAYLIGVQYGRLSENPNAYRRVRRRVRKNFFK
jgi:predicted transcriptional regulator